MFKQIAINHVSIKDGISEWKIENMLLVISQNVSWIFF